MDDLSRAYSKANKEADRLYGASRLKKMQENNKLLKDEYDLLMKKIQRGKTEYLPEDKANLEAAVKKAGITFAVEYDADNNIANYEELMTPLFNDLKAAEAAGGETPSDLEQERIDAAKERIDLVKEAISQFDSTREEIEDMEDEAEDKLDEWYQNNFDQLNYKLELQIELDESELKKLDYYLDKYSDDFSKMADSLELMIEKLNVHKGQLTTYKTQWDDLKAAYAAGNITQSQYIEGLKEVEDGMYSDLEAMN